MLGPLSPSTVSRLKQKWQGEYEQWLARPLEELKLVYLWEDGVYVKAGLEKDKAAVLVAVGGLSDGTKIVLTLEAGHRESEASWSSLLRRLKKRGLRCPRLVIGDGHLGIWAEPDDQSRPSGIPYEGEKSSMKNIVILLTFALFLALLPTQSQAAGKKEAGAILVLSGGVLVLAAFNYKGDQCPDGYSTHTFQNLPTQCVLISSAGSDVREATTGISYERPALMWSGVGAAAAGIVMMMLPEKARMDVTFGPHEVRVSKTFGF